MLHELAEIENELYHPLGNHNSSTMETHNGIRQRETYCTCCKQNTSILNASYVRLANGRAVIKGKCSKCGQELIKANIMPKSSALKLLRKKKRKGNKKYLPLI
ncbi:MAG: DUF5679 domain-containing protein [Thermoproteota archaeon]|nr:DUF5679 domain-containing protein [Thermoproteota archaeon]